MYRQTTAGRRRICAARKRPQLCRVRCRTLSGVGFVLCRKSGGRSGCRGTDGGAGGHCARSAGPAVDACAGTAAQYRRTGHHHPAIGIAVGRSVGGSGGIAGAAAQASAGGFFGSRPCAARSAVGAAVWPACASSNADRRRWQSRKASAEAGMSQASKVLASAFQAASRSSRSQIRLGMLVAPLAISSVRPKALAGCSGARSPAPPCTGGAAAGPDTRAHHIGGRRVAERSFTAGADHEQ